MEELKAAFVPVTPEDGQETVAVMLTLGNRQTVMKRLAADVPAEAMVQRVMAEHELAVPRGGGLFLRCCTRRVRAGETIGEAAASARSGLSAAQPGRGTRVILEAVLGQRGGAAGAEEAVEDELEEDDMEVIRDLFEQLDLDGSGGIGISEFREAIKRFEAQERTLLEKELAGALKGMMDRASAGGGADMTFQEFYRAVRELPRVRGQRVQWVRTLGLERELARLLKKGDFFDGLCGVRAMTDAEARGACAEFGSRLYGLLKPRLDRLREGGHMEAEHYKNTKFSMDGTEFEGSFADLEDFYQGPENFIGTPNPDAEEGLRREHCERSNSKVEYTSPNYNFVFTPASEFEFVSNPKQDTAYSHTPKDKRLWPADKSAEWKG